uniref:Uncharacterized protein n=1 Tax=Anguilla anguilla TaxID=7936 RepID=A0A0E9T971_ANGAN
MLALCRLSSLKKAFFLFSFFSINKKTKKYISGRFHFGARVHHLNGPALKSLSI